MGTKHLFATLAAAGLTLAAAPAAANFHIMRIAQVYGGDATHPDAQYVVLQMCIAGQNQLTGHSVAFFDAAGVQIGLPVTFPGPVGVGNDQDRIFVATSSAVALFGLPADLAMPAKILPAGGKLCFEPGTPIDCVGWGNYTGVPDPDPAVGTPYDEAIGLPSGSAVQRDLSIAGGTSTMNCFAGLFDDTNDSAADFDPTIPNPGNSAGASGLIDPDHIFLHGFENGLSAGWSAIVP